MTCLEFVSKFFGGRIPVDNTAPLYLKNNYRQIAYPIEGCLVIFTGNTSAHVGVFNNGVVLHYQNGGPLRQHVKDVLGYRTVHYYEYCGDSH